MDKFTATISPSIKSKTKRMLKKILQPVILPKKDLGKKIYFNALKKPVKENYIFYEAFAGLGILDNPRAIFMALLNDNSFADYTHIWAIDDLELAKLNYSEFASFDNVVIVHRNSKEYFQYLATCKYLIANTTFGYFFEKRPEQIYVNTWHGVPTKYMGYEHTVERVENARGPARHFLSADYLLSSNRFMTDIMYRRSYKLDGLFEGNLLEIGTPRIDTLIHSNKTSVLEKLNNLGIDTSKKIILYAPTWKGNLYNALDYNIEDLKDTLQKFSEGIDKNEYRIYLRVHYFLYRILAKDPTLKDILIPFTIDTNELLSVTDILISDYSSIFFDYLVTKKPIVFYVPDLEQYKSGRGLYVQTDILPGLASPNTAEISNALSLITTDLNNYQSQYLSKYEAMQKWCTYNEDGNAVKRLIDVVFHGKISSLKESSLQKDLSTFHFAQYQMESASYGYTHQFSTKKEKLLICFNTQQNSEDSYHELSDVLNSIDYTKKDVTLLVTPLKIDKQKQYFNTLPSDVRILVWFALPFITKHTPEFFEGEIRRALGNVHFDSVKIIGEITEYWAEFANNIR